MPKKVPLDRLRSISRHRAVASPPLPRRVDDSARLGDDDPSLEWPIKPAASA